MNKKFSKRSSKNQKSTTETNIDKNTSSPLSHDQYFKKVMAIPEVAKEFLQIHLSDSEKQYVDLSTLKIESGSFINEILESRENDMLFSADIKGEKGYIYCLVEQQTDPDKYLAFRILEYTIELINRHMQYYKEDSSLPVVINIVLYNGKKSYTVPTQIHQLFTHPELAKETLSGYKLVNLKLLKTKYYI